jgi:hypothetical protein
MHFIALNLLICLVIANLVSSLGINCRGCTYDMNKHLDNAKLLTSYISTINQSRWYEDYDLIACTDAYQGSCEYHVCAYLKGTAGANGSKIQELAQYIPGHASGNLEFHLPVLASPYNIF